MQPNACSIALLNGNAVLLIQRAYAPFEGLWTLPGGRMDLGETPIECVKRELFEETGLIVSAPAQVLTETVGEGAMRYRLAVFTARHPFRAPMVCDEIANWDWVLLEEIPRYKTTPNLARIVAACARHLDSYGYAS
ncbi:NUDIX domain-containing protein [Pelagibacterium xiamenense]|uniref:NUDIX domain-containing protein n=1 Tax=Pelagibacterium xiamenense TaxID=2901140 RepID=UPI001E517FD8|nr:NUDIX domain-containing protein [Pelagibacterium xiamenense]MCD7059308.1 NUDIX domain-containing protein [Pelagibacterium xiamenense]